MSKNFSYLKACEQFAQYVYKESVNSDVVFATPKRHSYRSVFACDRDRVMYCSSFRKLSYKTQVFNTQTSDNLRTRLTHTLEVSQIARTISHQLGFDEELTEAIALGHDVGHTPFGHIGERTLNLFSIGKDKRQIAENIDISKEYYGFKHNLQSVRVLVEYSENVKFSNYMLFGVREHSKLYWDTKDDVKFYDLYEPYCSYSYDKKTIIPAWSFEAFVVKWSDEIAQRHHDIEDAFLQNIIPASDIVVKVQPLVELINNEELSRKFYRLKEETDKLLRNDFSYKPIAFAHTLSSFLVDAYVTVLIKEISRKLKHFSNKHEIKTSDDFINQYLSINIDEIRELMSLKESKLHEVDEILGKSLKYNILDSYEVQRMDGKGAYIIRKLVRAYMSNPQQLPSFYVNRLIKVEIVRQLSAKELEEFLEEINKKLKNFPENISIWKDYECREVLRVITDNESLFKKIYGSLLRVIFDYVSCLTDFSATSQRNELY